MATKPFRPRKDDFVVKFKRLGREGALGLAHEVENTIEIDPRQSDYETLDTAIHEALHLAEPTWSEKEVIKKSRRISRMLYFKLGYHRTPPQMHVAE